MLSKFNFWAVTCLIVVVGRSSRKENIVVSAVVSQQEAARFKPWVDWGPFCGLCVGFLLQRKDMQIRTTTLLLL